MRTKHVSIFSLMLAICLCFSASAQQAGRIESMKLLTPDVGWAATNKKLFWTSDGGASWKDITPKLAHREQAVSSVFFLDASTGWALMGCRDGRDPLADDVCFEFASTTNAGADWTVVKPKIVDPVPQSVITEDGQGFSSTTFLAFADPQHGWAVLKRSLHVQASSGVMLRTADGGKTWTQLPKNTLPIADRFRFPTIKDGWMAGGGQPESDLYETHNGGDTWSQVVVRPPQAIKVEVWPPAENGVWPDYRLPYFDSSAHGFLIGSYWDGEKPNFALFSTTDLGANWKFERALPSIDGANDVSNGMLFVASTTHRMDKLTLTRLPLTEGSGALAAATADVHGIKHYNLGGGDELEMVNASHGWILADELFATSDGGTTWGDITPRDARSPDRQSVAPGKASATRPSASTGPPRPLNALPSVGNVSAHLGFDKSDVPCPTGSACTLAQSVTAMQALMNSSPYYDAYIYLPNSPNRHNNAILGNKTNGPLWVSSAEGQGWGIGPIWFGLQSACIIGQPNVKQYFGVNGADPGTQGAEAADSAVAQDQLLGIASGIIWVNIENYTTGGACSEAVQEYVDGFVTEMGVYNGYTAGVYANPGPIMTDISQVSTLPAAIWITKTPKTGPPSVTIWNQGISDSLWPNGQRMHQFLNGQTGVTWGGIALTPSVDEDIDNGPVLNANNGTKNFSAYSSSSFSYPSSCGTYAYGINDVWGGAFISESGQTGQIVGQYDDCNGYAHAFLLDSYVQYSNVDYPGAVWSVAYGVNNLGQIVGAYQDANYCVHGYLLNGGTYTSISNPNGVCPGIATMLLAINDAGQISGYYDGQSTGNQSFIYYLPKQKFYPTTTFAGVCCTEANGINGDATLSGTYSNNGTQTGFWEPVMPPNWAGTPNSYFDGAGVGTFGEGLNNNGDIAGYYQISYADDYALLFSNGVQILSFQYSPVSGTYYDTYAYGVNDFGQMVGYYAMPFGEGNYGFVATLQQ
jgi:photosystem II stability/assembly factor-like uncharacterized protein